MLFFLLAAHALMDFALQTNAIALCKCRSSNQDLQKAVPWYYWLTAHALLHGAAVAAVILFVGAGRYDLDTAVMYGLLEFAIHWLIDLAKCEGYTNIHIDQALHVVCKVIWALMLAQHVTIS